MFVGIHKLSLVTQMERERCGREIVVELVTLYIEDVFTRVITQEKITCLRVFIDFFNYFIKIILLL